MGTKQQVIRTMSETHSRLETLIHHVNYRTLEAEHKKKLKHKVVGVDKLTKEDYDEYLKENLENLLGRMKSFSYRTQPVRRAEIP